MFSNRSMTSKAALCLLAALPFAAGAQERVCAPAAMLKTVIALESPRIAQDHFARVPKTLYRYGEKFGRVEEARNPATGLQLLIVVSEPDFWIADLEGRRGSHRRDPGPTYIFHVKIFNDSGVDSDFIRSLEFGCELDWLSASGSSRARETHPSLGEVERVEYKEGEEQLILFLSAGAPARLELHRGGELYLAVRYSEYSANLPLDSALFTQPEGITFASEERNE